MEELIERAMTAMEMPWEVPASRGLRADAYFPPDGAMQFEVTHRSGDGTPLPAAHCVWVMGKHSKSDSSPCIGKCAEGWIVLLDSLDAERRAQCEAVMRQYGTKSICVCACNGRLIE